MADRPLQIDLQDAPAHSVWPWVIAAVAGLGLIVGARHVLATVPTHLADEARQLAAADGQADVQIDAIGRDLSARGVLTEGTDRTRFVNRLASIDGVRSVSHTLSVFDPVARERENRAAFGSAIGSLDLSSVAFEPGSAQFAAGSERALDELATLLTTWPEYRIRVAGHTDNTGRPEVNLRLSRERASAVADWLGAAGVTSGQVIAQGYGATQPIADNATEAGRSRNRRIEVRYVD